MSKYILKRVLISLATLIVILFVLFLMLEFMPGSPFNDEKLTEAQRILLNAKYGLDQPFFVRFFNYAGNMLKGDLGVSYVINKNFAVTSMVTDRLFVTIRIGLQAMILGSVIGLVLGIIAALKHNTWIDTLCSVISIIGVSVPSYVFALGLAYFVGYKMGLFPILYNPAIPEQSSVLPTIALSLFTIANVARFTRSEMIDVLGSDYIQLAQSKGIKEWKLIIKHALRNALIPIITVMGPLLVGLLTGSMVVEKIFGIPGLGSLMVLAIQYNDYNVVIACAFIYSALYIFTMLIVDILYGVIDPRIRVAKEGS
ncbi:ABC transporter permease [Anaerorhabdus sp.]|jgi:oligopeptide transport system permease protein|uniref:ABC transporter permease n=1 Tax=Anaerorhabdus sp. TaxID=1872524 RepID=UPI002FCB107E